mgnify:CR=1 FL=1
MPAKDHVTIDQIARLASVSKATVSRVLNEKGDVAPQTRERVEALITQLGYRPQAVATDLARGRSNLVGLVMPSLSSPWMMEVVRGVAKRVESSRYDLVLFTVSDRRGAERFLAETLPAGRVEGLMLILPPMGANHLKELFRSGFPLVVLDDRHRHAGIPWIKEWSEDGAFQAVQHLIAVGHRRVAFLSGNAPFLCSKERYAGYRMALEEAGIELDPQLVVEGDLSEASGTRAVERWWQLPEPPTAVFAANDLMAFGVLRGLQRLGLRVPQDVGLVGFDDIPAASYTTPPLTTVRQPLQSMGGRAVELLIDQIERGLSEPQEVRMETQLVVRGSTLGWEGMKRQPQLASDFSGLG